jgi:hypothetical protein
MRLLIAARNLLLFVFALLLGSAFSCASLTPFHGSAPEEVVHGISPNVFSTRSQIPIGRIVGPWPGISHEAESHIAIRPFIRWDEKAGLRRDAIRSQCSTCSRHKEKETGYEKD